MTRIRGLKILLAQVILLVLVPGLGDQFHFVAVLVRRDAVGMLLVKPVHPTGKWRFHELCQVRRRIDQPALFFLHNGTPSKTNLRVGASVAKMRKDGPSYYNCHTPSFIVAT